MDKIIRVSSDCLKIIEQFECGGNFRNFMSAYKCPAGIWTIGMGTTRYSSGEPVMPGDRITEQQVYEYVTHDLTAAEIAVANSVTAQINQHQFDALVDFVYNAGISAFKKSTLLKVINKNPDDNDIIVQFMRWKLVDGKPSAGLIRRRFTESWLYVHGEIKFQLQKS